MKHIQESYFVGFVTISVKGVDPELFFQKCIDNGMMVWNVKKVDVDLCEGNIRLNDIKKIRKIRRNKKYKIKFIDKKGIPFLLKSFLRKKEIIYALLISIAFIFLLSNILWNITITGVSPEMEEKINEQLKENGIHRGSWLFLTDPPGLIQQKLLNDLPELLWIGIDKKGTTYIIEGVEKVIVKNEVSEGPRNLVATKKGIIQTMFVREGVPIVSVNDYVEPGDVLVSGIIFPNEDNNNEHKKLVAAKGTITAETWYEVSIDVLLSSNIEKLTGRNEKKYFIHFGKFKLPIWGFGENPYEEVHTETIINRLKFLKWNLPIAIEKSKVSEKTSDKIERTKEEAIQIGIEQARKNLQLELGKDAKILSEKILQQTIDNGKVNLNLFITVEENIVKAEPIIQGD